MDLNSNPPPFNPDLYPHTPQGEPDASVVVPLSNWLQDLGLHHIADSLEDFGVTTVGELSVLRDSELQVIADELNLTTRQKIKFTVAIRKFELHEPQRVVLTPRIDKDMKQLAQLTNEARSTLTKVERTIKAVRRNAVKSREDLTAEFSSYHTQLNEREKILLNELYKIEQEKVEVLEKQSKELTGVIAELTQRKMDSEKLLRVSSIEEMSKSEKYVAGNVAKAVNLKFSRDPAANPHIVFQNSQSFSKQDITKCGRISSFATKPPIITKLVPHIDSVEVTWELNSEPETPSTLLPVGFGVKMTEPSPDVQQGTSGTGTEFEIEGKDCNYVVKGLKSATDYNVAVRSKHKFGWTPFGKVSLFRTLKKVRTPSAKGKRWTLEMSCKYLYGAENTYEALVDVSTTKTGAATNWGVDAYIMAVFDKPSLVSSVTVSVHCDASYVNGSQVQCYIDGEYKDIVRVNGVQNNQMKTFDFPPVITNKVRLVCSGGGYIATGHFIIA